MACFQCLANEDENMKKDVIDSKFKVHKVEDLPFNVGTGTYINDPNLSFNVLSLNKIKLLNHPTFNDVGFSQTIIFNSKNIAS